MTNPLVYVIVISNNRREDTLSCIASLFKSDYQNIKIMILDNHSSDGSVDAILKTFPVVDVVQLSENLGYTGNNNIGIDLALENGADWIFVLNDDTVLDQTCISSLIEVGISDPSIGIVGPMVYHFDEPNVIQSAGGLLGKYWQSSHLGQNELDHGQFQSSHDVEWVSGCAILVRREAIEEAGAFDPDFFLYWEETEWCIRARNVGWRVLHVPQAKLWHKGVKQNYFPKPYVTYYLTRNHLLTLAKHNAPLSARIYTWMQILRTLFSWSIKPQWRYQREHRNAMWKGVVDFLQHRWGQMSS